MNEEARIEASIQAAGKTAPRIRPEDLDAAISSTVPLQYHHFPGTTVTVCCLTLTNGYAVVGESACVDPDNFDEAIGRDVAYSEARNKVWPLLGYALRERLVAEHNETAHVVQPDEG